MKVIVLLLVCVVCVSVSVTHAKPLEVITNYISIQHLDIMGRFNATEIEEEPENIATGSIIKAPSVASCPPDQKLTKTGCKGPWKG